MQSKVNRVTNWRSVQPNRIEAMRQSFELKEREIRDMNPWKIETDGWSFSPQNVSLARPSYKRGRAFTGQLNMNRGSIPGQVQARAQLFRIGIAVFIAADIFLITMLLKTVL